MAAAESGFQCVRVGCWAAVVGEDGTVEVPVADREVLMVGREDGVAGREICSELECDDCGGVGG
jgi:hypothetical protein